MAERPLLNDPTWRFDPERFTYLDMEDDFQRWAQQGLGLGLQEAVMHNVTVKKDELIKRLEENKSKHRTMFLEAQEGYRAAVIKALDERLADARDGKPVTLQFGLVAPEDHTPDYERVLDMLSMSVDEEIELDYQSFAQLVRDEWTWRRQWVMSNSAYSGTAATEAASYGAA